MTLYAQTDESTKYLAAVAGLAPQVLRTNVALYKAARAVFLGLPIGHLANGQLQAVEQADLSLARRLAAHGTGLRDILADNAQWKAFVEAKVAKAVQALGGFDRISRTGEWAFVLDDVARDADGRITGYALPTIPFVHKVPTGPGKPPRVYQVDIALAEDGSGAPKYTLISGGEAAGADPL